MNAEQKLAQIEARGEIAFTQGLWYGWGRIDGGSFTLEQRHKIDVFKFAESVKANQIAFDSEASNFNESIQGQWAKFVAGELG